METQFRKTLITLLDDSEGINEDGYVALGQFAKENNFSIVDICSEVERLNGRYFLNEDHGIEA
jgi:hypothetical protein